MTHPDPLPATGPQPLPGKIDGRRARRAQTHGRIIAAAAGLMADRGLTGTTIDDVAAAAGVAKGSVFYNFGSKDALCHAVLEAGTQRLVAAMAAARAGRQGWQALEAVSRALLASFDESPDLGQVLATELFRRGRAWQDDLPGLRAQLVAPLVQVLAEVHAERRAAGVSSVQADAGQFESVAVSFLGALMFSAFDRMAYAPDRSLDALHASLMLTVSGLRA